MSCKQYKLCTGTSSYIVALFKLTVVKSETYIHVFYLLYVVMQEMLSIQYLTVMHTSFIAIYIEAENRVSCYKICRLLYN